MGDLHREEKLIISGLFFCAVANPTLKGKNSWSDPIKSPKMPT
jgi:hypothetical protein